MEIPLLFDQRSPGRIIDVVGDGSILDALYSLINDRQRHEKPLTWADIIAKAILEFQIQARRLENAVKEIFQTDVIELESL